MKKIAIFVEGQTELIFIRELLLKLFEYNLSFYCYKLHSSELVPVKYNYSNPGADIFFQIINIQNDDAVIGFIKEREQELINKGFETIIGLRDMYSKAYKKRSTKVDNNLNLEFMEAQKTYISTFCSSKKIKFFFSIMEIEAWLLAMPNIFNKFNSKLSVQYINNKLSLDLNLHDVESILKPSSYLIDIFNLCDIQYGKHEDDTYKLVSKIENDDIKDALNKSQSFNIFYSELIDCI